MSADEWQWPEWLAANWIAMDYDGDWTAFMDEPSMFGNHWDDMSDAQFSLTPGEYETTFVKFAPPPCDDWTKSLRRNPSFKDDAA